MRRRRRMKEADGLNGKGNFLYRWEERVVCMATVRFGVRKVADRH